MASTKFWYLLLDSATTGQPYEGSTADFVSLPPGSVVAEFRDAVLSKNPNKLARVDGSDLLVYKNKAAFDMRNAKDDEDEGKEEPLKASRNLDGLGGTEDEALIVVVPSLRISSQTTNEQNIVKKPNHKRKERWIKLNEILDSNAKKSRVNDSTAYSYISWNDVQSLFEPSNYVQTRREMDDAQLDFLTKYLSYTTKCFGSIVDGKEAKRLHYIAPILVCVCFLFDGDVEIVAEEDLTGNFVKAHGHFEFMLKRKIKGQGKTKAVCIVEAKMENLRQGMSQDLVGCEVAAEIGELDVVYGIVTNYVQWIFICSGDEKVEFDERSIRLTPEGPDRESLKEIAEKIYSMLSD